MSAILARVNFDGSPIVRDAFCRAFKTLAAYGGDGSDVWIEGPTGLGQHLLRFTPESCYEQQPHQWGDAVIAADARIDNREELCARFGLSQMEAAVIPDSHLVLRAYRLWGEDCTAHLLGDFAFAIWDRRNQRLFCARDHIGARPLYYYHTLFTTVIATDIRALQAFPDVEFSINELEVATHLIWPLVVSKNTFFNEIHILHPGQQMSVTAAGCMERPYWSADNAPDVRYKTVAKYAEHFRSVLEAAVSARIRTNYPIGAHLSGGLDSSGITVLTNRQLRRQSRSLDMTYTWSPAKSEIYPPVRRDERTTIEMLCHQENIPCHYGRATGQDFRDFLARDMAVEMTADLFEELPVLANAGRRGIRTILSGWGGDEAATFGGGGYIAFLLKKGRMMRLAQITRRHTEVRRPHRTLRFLLNHAIVPLLPNILYERVDPYYRSDRQPTYLHSEFVIRFPDATRSRLAYWRDIADPRKLQVRLLENGHLANRMATWAVWSSEHQLVHTYPLTDRRVLEFTLGLPPDMLYQNGVWRYLFREALKDILPPLPPKDDPVNEHKRRNLRLACWQILADEVHAGRWSQHDVPWLDLDKLRANLMTVPAEMTSDEILAFGALRPAVRVWHLWQRYGDRTGD